jgi:hypothetical protein
MRTRIQLLISIRIRIRIEGDKPVQIHADPDPGQILSHKKSNFHMRNILKVINTYVKKHTGTYESTKARKPGKFENVGQFPCFWIRICIPNTDPDPGQPYE